MKERNNKSKITMNKSEEHEVGERNAIGAGLTKMRVKNNKNKSTKNESEEQ